MAVFWMCFVIVWLVDCISILTRIFVFGELYECISNLFLLQAENSQYGNAS